MPIVSALSETGKSDRSADATTLGRKPIVEDMVQVPPWAVQRQGPSWFKHLPARSQQSRDSYKYMEMYTIASANATTLLNPMFRIDATLDLLAVQISSTEPREPALNFRSLLSNIELLL